MTAPDETKSSTIVDDSVMIGTVEDLGRFLRMHRKARKITLRDAAALAGCSVQFLHDLESGKPTIRMGNALDYARQLGVKFHASGPLLPAPADSAEPKSRKRGPLS